MHFWAAHGFCIRRRDDTLFPHFHLSSGVVDFMSNHEKVKSKHWIRRQSKKIVLPLQLRERSTTKTPQQPAQIPYSSLVLTQLPWP